MASMLGIGERMQVHSLLTCGGWRRTLNAGGLFFASMLGVGDGTSAWLPYSDCCIKCHEWGKGWFSASKCLVHWSECCINWLLTKRILWTDDWWWKRWFLSLQMFAWLPWSEWCMHFRLHPQPVFQERDVSHRQWWGIVRVSTRQDWGVLPRAYPSTHLLCYHPGDRGHCGVGLCRHT